MGYEIGVGEALGLGVGFAGEEGCGIGIGLKERVSWGGGGWCGVWCWVTRREVFPYVARACVTITLIGGGLGGYDEGKNSA